MMLEVLYLLTTCSVGLPCPAPLFKRNMEPSAFQYTREVCLSAARAYNDETPKRAAYCAGNDGSILAASGRIVPDEEYYDAVEAYMKVLTRDAIPASPSTSAPAR